MTTNLTTELYRLKNCFRLINDIASANDYYLFVGDYRTHSNSTLQPVYDNSSNTLVDAYSNMICGKKISSADVYPVVPNIPWTTGTVYTMYDSANLALPGSNFYVVTAEGGFNHVWKVLDNNFGSQSTVQPSIVFIVGGSYVQTADGYRWKYMASTDLSSASKFTTSGYFPLIANTTVTSVATPGSLDIFTLSGNGAFYNNYVFGTFAASDITVSGDQTLFNISNNQVHQVNGYYTDCLVYITGGTGQGQYAVITDFVANTVGNLFRIQNPFVTLPQNGTTFQITPRLNITSDGNQTINCVARALVNALASNSIYRIESLQPGLGYFNIAAINVTANAVVAVSNTAVVHAVLPPKGGHGANVFFELYANSVGIYSYLANTESGAILATNVYQQIGLLKRPQFANVIFTFTGNASGVFQAGESIYDLTITQFAANATVTLATANVSCNSANFVNQLVVGQTVYVNGAVIQLATVNSIVNSSFFTITTPTILASCTQAQLFFTNTINSGIVAIGGQQGIAVNNCTPNFHTGSFCVGANSGATALLASITRNGTAEFFGAFQELYKYSATLLNGNLQQGEQVIQGANSAFFYAVIGTGASATIYLSNFAGGIFGLSTITGKTSGATALLTTGYIPEVIFGTGDLLYIENVNPITRSNTQTEAFNLILSL